jgi:DNA-binding MarR family transcriptional regulator
MGHLSARELELCTKVSTLCACNQLRRASRELTRHYDAALAQSGLAATQLPILVTLGSYGDLPITILADVLSLDRTTLTRNIKILEARGLVQVVAHEEDARVHLASLTSEGARVLGDALERWERVQTRIEREFDPMRLTNLSRELDALREAART